MWFYMYCQIPRQSQSMYTPPRLVVKQSGSMGGVWQTFEKCEVLVMGVLPYSLCTKPVSTPPLVTLTNYILTKGMLRTK